MHRGIHRLESIRITVIMVLGLCGFVWTMEAVCAPNPTCKGLPVESFPGIQSKEPYTSYSKDPYDVEVSTGELVLTIKDLEIPWPGFWFRFKRTYRSQSRETTSMGAGWSHNYLERLAFDDKSGTIIYHRPEAWIGAFTLHDNGEDPLHGRWTGPEGSHLLLRFIPSASPPGPPSSPCDDGEFVLRLRDGELHYFNSCGALTRLEDRYGNYVTLHYGIGSLQGLLVKVASHDGYEVIFDYRKRQLHSFTDCGLDDINRNGKCDAAPRRTITFDIGPTAGCQNDLLSVTSPASVQAGVKFGKDVFVKGRVTKYKYECVAGTDDHDPRNHNLRNIIDGKESADSGIPFITFQYYGASAAAPEYDHVQTIAHRGADSLSYEYKLAPLPETRVTNRTGGLTEYWFDSSRQLKERRRYIDTKGHYIRDTYGYDVHNHQQTKLLGWLSNGTYLPYEERYRFDAQGDIIERRIGGDGPDAIVTRFTYDPIYGQLRTTTDPRAFPDANNLPMNPQCPEEPDFANVAVRSHTVTRQIDYQESAYGALPRELTQYIETSMGSLIDRDPGESDGSGSQRGRNDGWLARDRDRELGRGLDESGS